MFSPNPLSVVILAAGKGTRMKSTKAKVLHEVFHKPMVHHVLEATGAIAPMETIVIVGHQEESVKKALGEFNVTVVRQAEQLGTGHAVQMAEPIVADENDLVMILCGDSPLIRPESLLDMYNKHVGNKATISVMSTMVDDPTGYGRIISEGETIEAIVEEKDANQEQKRIKEVNGGIYIVERNHLFKALVQITPENNQGEYYLTDIVSYSVKNGIPVHRYLNSNSQEIHGINSRVELEAAHILLRQRRNNSLMMQGISMINQQSIEVSPFSDIGVDTILRQNIHFLGQSLIGSGCDIGVGTILTNSTVGDNVSIGAYCHLSDCEIESNKVIPPMTVLHG